MTVTDRLAEHGSWVEHSTFRAHGGTALGAEVAARLAEEFTVLTVPRHVVVPLDTFSVQAVLDTGNSYESGLSIRYSGSHEAFSPDCRRGANSTGLRIGRADLRRGAFTAGDRDRLVRAAPAGTKAVVLQELVPIAGLVGPVILYSVGDVVTVEVHRLNGSSRQLHGHDIDRLEDERAGTGPGDIREDAMFGAIAPVLRTVSRRLGFPLDVEGFWTGTTLVLLQLRPVPADQPTDPALAGTADHAPANAHVTRFVWGAFDVTGVVVPWTDRRASRSPVGGFATGHRLARESVALLPDDGGGPVVLDRCRGFRISHDRVFLPPVGPGRDGYRYVSVASWPMAGASPGLRLRAVSDGTKGWVNVL